MFELIGLVVVVWLIWKLLNRSTNNGNNVP
jgi:hypothetical protein